MLKNIIAGFLRRYFEEIELTLPYFFAAEYRVRWPVNADVTTQRV